MTIIRIKYGQCPSLGRYLSGIYWAMIAAYGARITMPKPLPKRAFSIATDKRQPDSPRKAPSSPPLAPAADFRYADV